MSNWSEQLQTNFERKALYSTEEKMRGVTDEDGFTPSTIRPLERHRLRKSIRGERVLKISIKKLIK